MDEVNYLASNIKNLSESQKNTLLPKIVETLEGLDWSDSLFNRMDFAATKEIYREIGKMTKDFKWLEPIMQRSSFSVPYNKHIRAVVENELNNRFTRRKIARDDSPEGLKKFLKIINHTVWGKELQNKDTRKEKLFDYNERLSMLNSMVRQAEDFMSNDLADMATLLNLQRLFKKYRYDPKKISQIHHKVEMFKARNYLNRGERDKMDYESHLEDSLSQSQKADIDLIFRKADEILGVSKKQKDSWIMKNHAEKVDNYYYLSEPGEMHARINEIRINLNLSPSDKITTKQAASILDDIKAGKKYGIDPDWAKLFKNPEALKKMMNKVPLITGAIATTTLQE